MGQAQFGRAASPSVLFQSCLAGLSCVPDIESLGSTPIAGETVVLTVTSTWVEERGLSERRKMGRRKSAE